MIKLIVALDKNNLIGKGNKMPWHIREEFQHFKRTTIGHSLLFGKNTFLGLLKKLNGRKNIVLSENDIENSDLTIHNEEELIELFNRFKNSNEVLFIAGGKTIYEKYFDWADELIISRIHNEYDGNVYLNLDLSNYYLDKVESHEFFDVEIYKKINKEHFYEKG